MSSLRGQVSNYQSKLDAKIDKWTQHNCKFEGEYYITAVVSKENINYWPENYINHPLFKNLGKIKEFCKPYKKIVIATFRDSHEINYKADKFIQVRDWYLMCGKVQMILSPNFRPKIVNNDFEDFIVYDEDLYTDLTPLIWAALTKDW